LSEKSKAIGESVENLNKAVERLVEVTGDEEITGFSEELFGKDSDFTEKLLALIPQLFNAYFLLSQGLAGALSDMDEDKRREAFIALQSGLKGELVGEAINASCRTMIQINEENPRVFAEGSIDFFNQILDSLDSGVLRKGIVAYADSETLLMEEVIDKVMPDAVFLANVMGIIPPIINDLLRLLARAFSSLEMPPEILASAIFNTLSDVDTEQLGSVINGLTAVVKDLHEGNLLLGRDEPRFKAVFTHLAEDLLAHVDKEQAALAVVALAEDTETMFAATGDLLYKDPELLNLFTAASLASLHAIMRGMTDAFARLAQLPDASMAALTTEIAESLEPQNAAKLLNAILAFRLRLLENKPDIPARFVDDFMAALDIELFWKVTLRVSASLLQVDLADIEKITTNNTGAMLAMGISAYNQTLDKNPQAVKETMSQALEGVDAQELEKAVRRSLVPAAEAVVERPDLIRAFIRPATSALWTMFKGLIKNLGALLKRGPG
jgi:hypothetical protein